MHESMRMYCMDVTQCRHQQLMKQFCEFDVVESPTYMHMCCDVCADQCKCETCTVDISISKEDIEQFECSSDVEQHPYPLPTKPLREKLLQMRRDIVNSEPTSLLLGADVLSGLTNTTIDMIVKNSMNIKDVRDVQTFGVTSFKFATVVYKIVSKYVHTC